jgi:hypothetical protein
LIKHNEEQDRIPSYFMAVNIVINYLLYNIYYLDSVIGVAIRNDINGLEIVPSLQKDFPATRPMYPPVKWAPALFSGSKSARTWR